MQRQGLLIASCAAPLLLITGVRVGSSLHRVYTYTDPLRFGIEWEAESLLEVNRSGEACKCERGSQATLWQSFQTDLVSNLLVDPDFSGPWVHALCGSIYSTLFSFVSFVDQIGTVDIRSTCSAGLLAMAIVCAQSLSLQGHASSSWQWTERVVLNEGSSVADHWGRMPLAECLKMCEANAACASVAHGPGGCHLKDRCVVSGERLQDLPSHAEGYRTYFRDPCWPVSDGATVRSPPELLTFSSIEHVTTQASAHLLEHSGTSEESTPASRSEEIDTLVDISLQLVERSAHCLDGSDWPFSVLELVANRVNLAEDPAGFLWSRAATLDVAGDLALGSVTGKTTSEVAILNSAGRGHGAEAAVAIAGSDGSVRRALERFLVRWARSFDGEVGFWHELLLPPDASGAAASSAEDAANARRWVETGEVRWYWDDLCKYLSQARTKVPTTSDRQASPPPRILNAGSGPLAAGPLECRDTDGIEDATTPVVSADGLARFYLRTFDAIGIQPPRVALQCPVETLLRCFPRGHFDIVHMRNALDHAVDPVLGLYQMLAVTRPGGWVLLRHARNEGVPGQFRMGLHQWAFDVAVGGSPATRFVIWNPSLRADVSTWLLSSGLAQEVRTELRPHPGGGAEDYVFVDIRKPW